MHFFATPARIRPCHLVSACALALATSATLRAASIAEGDITTALGPTFFVDDAALGGTDTDISHGSTASFLRLFNGLLTPNQGPTRVTLTGFGFATHTEPTANDATSVAVTFTYLGADGAVNGGDDVPIGTATGSFTFSGGKEYQFIFDTPLVADLTITGTRFRIQLAPAIAGYTGPANTALKLKTGALASEPAVSGAKLSVAGVAAPLLNPQRVNLAKFQPVTATSVNGQRLASYVTDGVTGNDNRWQGSNSTWQSVVVDFPFPVEVGSAQVFTGVDDTFPIASYSIQFWNGSAWSAIPGGSVTGNTSTERNLVFTNPITASSFRLISAETSLRVRELALYPPNGPGGFTPGTDLTVNLAYQRPAAASGNTAGNFALKAVDGRAHPGSLWQTTAAGTNTLDIDLRVGTKIGSAHLYSGTTGVSPLADFVLKYWDGTAWQGIPGATVTGNATADRVVTFTTPVKTSQVRLEFNNPGTAAIRELCIFPANTGNTGYPIGTNIINSGAIADYETYNDSFHLITHPSSGRKLTVPGDGQPTLDPGSLTIGQSQYQVLLNLSNGTYRLRNRASGNCIAGAQLSKTPGLPLTDAPYSALPHQDWILDPLGGGAFQIINSWSGLVIDTQASATAAGTPLIQNAASGSPSQRWQFAYSAGLPKKGIGGTTFAMATNPNWAYNWGRANTQTIPDDTSFHPMQWGNFSWDIGSAQGPLWQNYPAWRTRSDGIHLLAFNEPDRTDQSNMTQSSVLSLWPRLQELDLPLVSPSPGTIGGDGGWLDSFYAQADALGYRVDYTAVHTYPGPSGGSSDNLINFANSAYTYHSRNRPVWLTEFSFVDWGKNQTWSEEDNYNCLAEFLWRAENLAALRKYALFVFTEDEEFPQPPNAWQAVSPAPRSNSYDINGNMTAFGKLYAAWDGDTTVRTGKIYHFHHKASRKRIANLTTQSNLSGRNIRIDGSLVNWTLVSAGVSNRYYIVSSLDGRRLRRQNSNGTDNADGTSVALVATGTTGAALEWALTPGQHGWYFIEHPTLATRLKLAFNNSNFVSTYSMVAGSNTGDDVQWRFIVPVQANTPPVLAAIPARTVNEGTQATFTASASDPDPFGPVIYSLVGAPGGATINSTTGVFTWTTNESHGPNTYDFTVRASDGRLAQNLPVTVTVSEVNVAPVLAVIPAQTLNAGAELAFTASATDADLPANTLTYSLIGAPAGASINGSTGLLTWIPGGTQGPGVFSFNVRVSDGSLTSTQQITVTVEFPLPSPEVDTDGDGLSDLLEHAFLTDPATPNANPFRVVAANAGTITLEFPWNWQAAGLSWQIRHGHDLSNIAIWPVVAPGATTTTRDGDIDRITVTPAMAHPDRGFYVLKVIGN
jgi:Glycosyl hydrolase catalytic core/Ricin-type beta-trefoil lectin domain-like/Putative Ig domain